MATMPPASSDIDIGSGTGVGTGPAKADPLIKTIPIVTTTNVLMFFIGLSPIELCSRLEAILGSATWLAPELLPAQALYSSDCENTANQK
jgi:hypothetical protein